MQWLLLAHSPLLPKQMVFYLDCEPVFISSIHILLVQNTAVALACNCGYTVPCFSDWCSLSGSTPWENDVAGECCGNSLHSWVEVLNWQMVPCPGKFYWKTRPWWHFISLVILENLFQIGLLREERERAQQCEQIFFLLTVAWGVTSLGFVNRVLWI